MAKPLQRLRVLEYAMFDGGTAAEEDVIDGEEEDESGLGLVEEKDMSNLGQNMELTKVTETRIQTISIIRNVKSLLRIRKN